MKKREGCIFCSYWLHILKLKTFQLHNAVNSTKFVWKLNGLTLVPLNPGGPGGHLTQGGCDVGCGPGVGSFCERSKFF